ncbi:hypothetical protein EJ06DRAFT_525848 [Trichodelitschia bisporula]|uniref:Zn(2)-C6 fungal-type domain-containing protein n=1 Tax=Trichodelitschia bisporula TaxID=703511 RepID=A0A6G1IAM5_9PEZI|nr:hypothetical protein EJ06DRAFT_525848 [Trichodelitschia bisporula]
MNAPQLPALPGSGGSDTPPPKSIQYSKRGKITIVACVSCRRRKTKCDGRRPICSQCQGRSGTCHYDMSEEHRRLTFLRENVEHLAVEKNTLESLISSLRSDSVEEALEVLRRLRSGAEPYVLAQQIQASQSLAQVRLDSSSSHRQPSSSSDRSCKPSSLLPLVCSHP